MLDREKIIEQVNKARTQKEEETSDDAPPKSAIDDLRNGGTLSRSLPGYQERTAQIEMTQLIEQAIREEKPALLEAATGTGKSLSYLISVIRSGKKAIISTANKALQEQIYGKDVPFCQQHIQPFEAALLKGKSNYLCLQRFDLEQNEGMQAQVQDLTFKRIEKMIEDKSFNGDFESLPFTVPGEMRARINVDENECARRKCPLFKDCYYYQIREQAKQAKVIITNHDLLLLDAQSHNKLLPAHDIVVVDEAHTLEAIASKQFTVEVKPSQITSLLALQRVKSSTEEKTREAAKQQAEKVWIELDQLIPSNGRVALTKSLPSGIALAKTIERLSNQLNANKPISLTEQDDVLFDRTISRTDTLAGNIRAVFSIESKKHVYYLERDQDRITVSMAPLDVAPLLRDTLFSQDIVIATSATLSTPNARGQAAFDYYKEQVGMDSPNLITRILPLVFDYQQNALLYLPNDLPEPAYGKTETAAAYERAVAQRMQDLVEASAGRAFLLFSSRRMLNSVADQIMPHLKASGHTTLCQNDLPTSELIKQFRTSEKAVLFGLKTFWEGVDVSGEALSLVVIDKLPFSPMDDPVVAAKLKYIEAKGQNAFADYSIPGITLALKQGVGRLIRSHSDRGVMTILDTRLHTKSYGKKILACLPPAQRVFSLKQVQDFFLPLAEERRQFSQVCRILTEHGLTKHTYFQQMSNKEIIQKMQDILDNQERTNHQLAWMRKGLTTILEKDGARKQSLGNK